MRYATAAAAAAAVAAAAAAVAAAAAAAAITVAMWCSRTLQGVGGVTLIVYSVWLTIPHLKPSYTAWPMMNSSRRSAVCIGRALVRMIAPGYALHPSSSCVQMTTVLW
jgi:hypothetical protein